MCLEIEAHTGAMLAGKAIPPSSYSGSTDVATMCQNLAGQAGLAFENAGVNTKLSNPYHFGTLRTQFYDICRAAGIEGVIQNNQTMIIVPKKGYRSGDPILVSPQTGQVGYPAWTNSGIVVRTLFNPNVELQKLIQVQSDITPACGTWKVTSVIHDIASELPNGPWFTTIEAVNPNEVDTRVSQKNG